VLFPPPLDCGGLHELCGVYHYGLEPELSAMWSFC
jgi:hypothetical protein